MKVKVLAFAGAGAVASENKISAISWPPVVFGSSAHFAD